MSDYQTKSNFLRTVKVQRVDIESPLVKTLSFSDSLCAKSIPGQFIMVWLPGFDEIPMSISSVSSKDLTSITVAKVGEATEILHEKKKGDLVGVRGPFGNGFAPIKGKALLVGGGTGVSPLIFLARKLLELKTDMTFLFGAKTSDELPLFSKVESLISETNAKILISVEDGTCGHKGVVTELAQAALQKEDFDMIYACGKEQMLLKIFALAEKNETALQVSLERLMRCAIGLCGSCTIGKYRVCVDGPVFTGEQLREVRDELGRSKRDFDGRKTPV